MFTVVRVFVRALVDGPGLPPTNTLDHSESMVIVSHLRLGAPLLLCGLFAAGTLDSENWQ